MSDEMEAPEVQETQDKPETATTGATGTDWQRQYEELRPEYTRTTQELAQARKVLEGEDEDAFWSLAEKYGYTRPDEDDPEPELDEAPVADPRVDHLLEWQAEQQYERDLNRFLNGRDLPDVGRKVVDALSRSNGHNAKALQDAIDTWFSLPEHLKDSLGDQVEGAEEKPKKRRAPHVPAGGRAATGVPDYSEMSRDEIDEAMVARARALDTQT